MGVYVGLDCGGSSSRVLAVDAGGNVLFQGQSGAANLVSTPESRLRKNLLHATEGCPRATHVCGCFAGLISEEIRARGEDHLRHLFPAAHVRAEPDYTAAFYASPPETDLCIIAGTGSLVCSKGPNGIVKSGGRGYILGDYGSGYRYGLDAVLHYLDHPQDASDALRAELLRVFGSLEEGQIVPQVYRGATPATLLAKLLKVLGTDARNGEVYALESIRRNTRALTEVVVGHVSRHLPRGDRLTISLAGGVWKAAPHFKEELEAQIGQALPDRQVIAHRITRPPLYGAVELAKEMSIGN